MADWDTWVENVLVEHGTIEPASVGHARALRQRGFEHCALEEILMDLGHVTAEDVARLLASATGIPRFRDEPFDPALVRGARRGRLALPLRLEGKTLHYATTRPYDEALGDELRFAASAVRAVPCVATEAEIARTRRRAVEPSSIEETPPPEAAAAHRPSPKELMAEWEEAERHPERADSPLIRLTNTLLLDHVLCAPGSGVRIELFDEPRIRAGVQSCYGEAAPQFWDAPSVRSLLDPIARRLQYMAARDVLSDELDGWIFVVIGPRERTLSARVRVRKTSKGRVTTVARQAPWQGQLPDDPAFRSWRAHTLAFARARSTGQLEAAEREARAALREADGLGAGAELERVSTLLDLARFLDWSHRETEARPLAERALELGYSVGLGPRVEGDVMGVLGNTTLDDLEQRLGFFARARNLLDAPGVGREPIAHLAGAMAHIEHELGRPERALAFAQEAHTNDVEWFGAETELGHAALVDAALARSALGDVLRARELADDAARVGLALGLGSFAADWARARASLAAGDRERALAELRKAASDPDSESFTALRVRVDLALVVEQLGDVGEARELASSALRALEPLGAIFAASRRDLEELLRRAGPYR